MIEFGEEFVLSVGDSVGVESGNFGSSFSLVDSGFGLRGKKGAVTLRVGVTLGNCGGDAGGAGVCGDGIGDGSDGIAYALGAACAMSGEALGHLFLQCKRRCGFRFGRGFVQ